MLRNQLVHQYNVALRSKGKYLNSNIILNYKGNNTGMEKQHNNALNLAYKGDVNFKDRLDFCRIEPNPGKQQDAC